MAGGILGGGGLLIAGIGIFIYVKRKKNGESEEGGSCSCLPTSEFDMK